jgi:hypothetical protein
MPGAERVVSRRTRLSTPHLGAVIRHTVVTLASAAVFFPGSRLERGGFTVPFGDVGGQRECVCSCRHHRTIRPTRLAAVQTRTWWRVLAGGELMAAGQPGPYWRNLHNRIPQFTIF